MHFVLNEVVHQRHKRPEEGSSQVLPIPNRRGIRRAQRQTSQRPRQRRNQITYHEDVMPIMVIGARNVCPPPTGQGSKDSHARHELRQSAAGTVAEAVEEEDQDEARARADGDEDLEDGALWVAVADGSAHGGEPFDGVAVVLVLHDFLVVERDANDESAEEGDVCRGGVRPRDPLAWDLGGCQGERVVVYGGGVLTTATTSPSLCLGGIFASTRPVTRQ